MRSASGRAHGNSAPAFLLQLFGVASESVRSRLKAADPDKEGLIRDMVAKASEQFQAESRRRSAEYAAAETAVRSLYKYGGLSVTTLTRIRARLKVR